MKKFKQAFSLSLIVFLAFYLFAIVRGAKNPYENLFSKKDPIENENQEDTKKDKEEELDQESEEEEKPVQMIEDEFLFLLFGTDSHDIDVEKGYRSDTMILSKVNFKTGEVRLVNIPRDTRVMIDGYGFHKLNHAHSYGGTRLLLNTIRKNFDLKLDYYVKVDYALIEKLVDAIGGVEYEVPYNMNYYDPTDKPPLKINIKAGKQLINGHDAVGVLRYRNNLSDIQRIERQQDFMKAFMEQALSLKTIGRLPKIFSELKSNIRTNFGEKQILEAIISLPKIDLNSLKMGMIPGNGKTIDNVSYWLYNENETKNVLRENFGEYLNAQ